MVDLKITYTNKEGKQVHKEYDTVMDFTDAIENNMESGSNNDVPLSSDTDVTAEFWENKLLTKHFDTIQDLYSHCINIIR